METWLRPMLCDEADEVPTGDEWVVEPKIDGWRVILHRTATGVKVYGGRNASDYTGKLPYLEGVVSRLPEDTVIDGELVAREGGSGGVQSIMFANGPHEPSAASPPLTMVAFDAIRVQGVDIRRLEWHERRAMLEAAKFVGPLVFTSKPVPASCAAHDQFLADGYEGSVAKKVTGRYSSGSRSPVFVKIKPQSTCDAEVVGFKDGTGSRAGGVGAFEIKMDSGARTRVGSGFTDELLADINANRDEWLGATIEIAHHGLGKTGKPRHPVFLRRRDDLPAPAPRPKRKPRSRGGDGPSGRPRNYKQMLDENLLAAIRELEAGVGDAYDRALNRHTGDPDSEREIARQEARNRGLIQ